MARSMTLLWHIKIRRFLQSSRGKLGFILSLVLITFTMTYILYSVHTPPNVWHFDCRADGYFNHLGKSPLTAEKSNARLTFSIENNQAKLTYRLQSLTNGIEVAQLLGEVELLDMGSLTYHLVLTLQPTDWQDNSLLLPYLENEFSIAAEELLAKEVVVSQQIQISYLDKTLTKARLDFVPSNNVWACQLN